MPIPLKNQTIEQLGGSETVGFNTEDSQTHTHTHTHRHTHTQTQTQRDQIQNIMNILSQCIITKKQISAQILHIKWEPYCTLHSTINLGKSKT